MEQEFKKLATKVLKDPGAIAYIVHRGTDNPNKFMVYEKYESQDAFKYHTSTPHFKEFGQATKGMFAGRAEVTFYKEIM